MEDTTTTVMDNMFKRMSFVGSSGMMKDSTFKGHVPLHKVAQFMGSNKSLYGNEIHSLSIPHDTPYFVVIKNITTGEQYMQPKPMDSLDGWQYVFLEQPIFKKLNLALEPQFCNLAKPRVNDEMWAKTEFTKNKEKFLVITSLAFHHSVFEIDIDPSSPVDFIALRAHSPILPANHSTFKHIQSSQLRRACALQFALQRLAVEYGFDSTLEEHSVPDGALPEHVMVSSLIHGDGIVEGSDWCHYQISGGFISNTPENNAGSVVTPMILQSLHFLILALNQSSQYFDIEIIQPHKYGYILRLPDLAGWNVMTSINMHGSNAAMESEFINNKFHGKDDFSRLSSCVVSSDWILNNYCSYNVIRDLLFRVEALKLKINQEFEAEQLKWKETDAEAAAPFQEITSQTSDIQKDKLPRNLWHMMMIYVGLNVMAYTLSPVLLNKKREELVVKGNTFIKIVLEPHAQIKPIKNETNVGLVHILFEFCKGLAKEIYNKHYTKPKDIYKHVIKHQETVVITAVDAEKLNGILRNCIGVLPDQWCLKMFPGLCPDAVSLGQIICNHMQHYSILFSDIFNLQFYNEFILNAKFVDEDINRAEKDYQMLSSKGLSELGADEAENVCVHGVAYALLTADAEKAASKW